MSSIFISHSSRDAEVAAEIRQRLSSEGHRSVFLDFDPADGIPAGLAAVGCRDGTARILDLETGETRTFR